MELFDCSCSSVENSAQSQDKMQSSEMGDVARGAATWRTGRDIRAVFDSLFGPSYENMTSSTEPEIHNKLHCR